MASPQPRITPVAQTTPNYYLDQIDIAVELPMGLQGVQGPPGTSWYVTGDDAGPTGNAFQEGDLFLGSDGMIWIWDGSQWKKTDVDLIPKAGTGSVPAHGHDNQYLPLTGGTLTGMLKGTDATFTGKVNVSNPDPLVATEVVNVDFLNIRINNINLSKFFGDASGNAIKTMGSWSTAQGQAIYQQTNGLQMPPGVRGPTTGMTMRQSTGNLAQFICDIPRNLWFVRTETGGSWTAWTTLTPVVSVNAPVDPAPGSPSEVPHGTIWIQTDSAVTS